MSSNSVCVDASVALAWLFYDEHRERADELFRTWATDGIDMIVPPMFHAELTSAIRRQVHFRRILPFEGERLFALCADMPVKVMYGWDVYSKAWQLAAEFDLPVCYDTQYLAVAELRDCQFWTLDQRLINAVRGKSKRLMWVGEYEPGKRAKGKTGQDL